MSIVSVMVKVIHALISKTLQNSAVGLSVLIRSIKGKYIQTSQGKGGHWALHFERLTTLHFWYKQRSPQKIGGFITIEKVLIGQRVFAW